MEITLKCEQDGVREAIVMLKGKDLWFALWDISQVIRKLEKSDLTNKDVLSIFKTEYYSILEDRSITLEELT